MLRFARPDMIRRRWLITGVVAALGSVAVAVPPASAAAAPSPRVNLRVLVVTNGDPGSLALEAELDREGIPYTEVDTRATGRPTIDDAYLEDAATATGRFQAVILPNQAGAGLSAAEISALDVYETAYGVRQVNGYDFPTSTMGAVFSGASGTLDGSPATVTPAGLAGPFSYLKGQFTIEDVDPAVSETFGYLANPDPAIKAGATFTPLVNGTLGGTTGSILGVYGHDGREEMIITASFNSSMQWFNIVAEGIVSWATRGISLGFDRNYLAVHVDDVFLADGRWSSSGNCTPGDGCVDPSVTTKDIRMVRADVDTLVTWQNANKVTLTMVFNGGGSDLWKAATGSTTDPLLTAYLANEAQFPWVSHTVTHPFLGCIQIVATVVGGTWHCATSQTETPRMDADIPGAVGADGIYYAAGDFIRQQLQDNITWATTNGLGNFDPSVLVTGEHSGLLTVPQQPNDNPFLADALAGVGVRWTASDASREADTRALSATTSTVPRHPMNIFYNAGTYRDEVDEYNWIYTSTADGGSGICTANPATSTCIAPLPAADDAQAKTSFDSYIKPIEIRNALRYVLTNDPRPFYAHQSNLTEDGILYPVLDGILTEYNGAYDTTTTPLVQTSMSEEGQALTRMAAWKAASTAAGFVDGYVDAAGVHLPTTSAQVPLTAPSGSTGGAGLQAYAGAVSGWLAGGSTVGTPTAAGGYLVPTAPTGVTATAGNGSATVSWTPGVARLAPVTTWTVTAYTGTTATVAATATITGASTTSLVIPLSSGSYTFDVRATSVPGVGPASGRTAPELQVVGPPPAPAGGGSAPATVAGAPTLGAVTAGNAQLQVSWMPPAQDGGAPITGYLVQVYQGTTGTVVATATTPPGATTRTITGLVNGTGYTVDVAAVNAVGTGPASARSAIVTPAAIATAPAAVKGVGVRRGDRSVTVTWKAPGNGGSAIIRYLVRVYLGKSRTSLSTLTVKAPALSTTVRGLKNGTGYTVDVRAANAVGTGAVSSRSAVTVPASRPGAPVITHVAAGAPGGRATASLTWRAPKSNGGSSVVAYRVVAVRLSRHGHVVGHQTITIRSGKARSLVLRLPAGVYRFTVRAVNGIGAGASSSASKPVRAR